MSSAAPAKLTFPSWPVFAPDEVEAVVRVLESGRVNYWTGTEGTNFEREWAELVGTQYGVAIANGTVTLELALMALGVGPGDEVIIPPRTYIATAFAVMLRGATPVFADVDLESGNLTAAAVEQVRTQKTKAVIPVHIGGWPCEMDDLVGLGLPTIEDCAQAHGATYKGRNVGSIGTIGSWSFCQDKIMTLGGEGGAVTTNDRDLWDVMWSYKDHGKSWNAVNDRQHPAGFRWLSERVGTNWRLTEMQSAIGRIQLQKLPAWSRKRRELAARLDQRFADHPMIRVTVPPPHIEHAYYRWYAYLRPEALRSGWTRDRITDRVNELGVWCQSGSCGEIYLEKAFEGTGLRPEKRLPGARQLAETAISLRTDPVLFPEQVERMADLLEQVLGEASR